MKKFMDEDFMLQNNTAEKLYKKYAKDMPIIDYHCHLSPCEMYEDEQFKNITQIFLGGDHYKWRYMRSCGIDEKYITGDAGDYEKFEKYCETLQYAIGNPLYHWTHLELSRYFGIDTVVTKANAKEIWEKANACIGEKKMSPSTLINSSNVETICTTDDPCDDLSYHEQIAEKKHIKAQVLPAFRPDKALNIEKDGFADYVVKLSETSGVDINTYDELIFALYKRIEFFDDHGCKASDHALGKVPYEAASYEETGKIFEKALKGKELTEKEAEIYKTKTLILLAKKYHELGWAMQLHMGALRNNSTKMFGILGADTGFDSIADYNIAESLSKLLDTMDKNEFLPKTILYSLDPNDNYTLATMAGNFQSAEAEGKIQFGAAWWFNDHYNGMRDQMKALADVGVLAKFIGMLTDSRSFLSYTRHEYFRRILCDMTGEYIETGMFPNDEETAGKIISDICYNNAKKYFGF